MSTAKQTTINIAQLPEADQVKNGDFFVIDDTVVSKKIDFKNMIFGLDNVTFASTISAHSTEIAELSTNLTALSTETYQQVDMLESLITTSVQAATGSLVNLMYPVGSIKYTIANVNPGTTLPGTTWNQIAQGRFIAAVGTGYDANNCSFEIRTKTEGNNTACGEYTHKLITCEIPKHSHDVCLNLSNYNACSYQNGPQPQNWRLDVTCKYTTTEIGGDGYHNNIPPPYGLYVWERVA